MRRREFIRLVGDAVAWPLAAHAQPVPVDRVSQGGAESGEQNFTDAFRRGLNEQGYVERRNVEILYRWTEMRDDRLAALAADLVDRRVAVIVATRGTAPALAALSASKTIPIVFSIGADPVELGLVASLSRPGHQGRPGYNRQKATYRCPKPGCPRSPDRPSKGLRF